MPLNVLDLPNYQAGYGLQTPYGILLPPGGKVAAYVRSTGLASQEDASIGTNLVTTLAAGLSRCRAGYGDTVVCLPGHSESVTDNTMLDNLVSGCRVIGVGWGSMQPVFRWTNTAGSWVVNDNDVQIHNLHLRVEGASGITKAVVWTGADGLFAGNRIQVASGASNKAAIAFEVGTGADRFRWLSNRAYGTTNAITNGLKIVAAVTDMEVGNSVFQYAVTEVGGLIHVTAAAINMYFHDLDIYNTVASGTAGIVLDDVACDGHYVRVYQAMKNDGTATDQGVIFGSGALVQCNQVYVVDSAKKNGILSPVVET